MPTYPQICIINVTPARILPAPHSASRPAPPLLAPRPSSAGPALLWLEPHLRKEPAARAKHAQSCAHALLSRIALLIMDLGGKIKRCTLIAPSTYTELHYLLSSPSSGGAVLKCMHTQTHIKHISSCTQFDTPALLSNTCSNIYVYTLVLGLGEALASLQVRGPFLNARSWTWLA
eukprot:1148468-Pelagomonas_calceolata.AAC.4